MGLTVDDLKPKEFEIDVKGVKLTCKPLRMRHSLMIAKIGNVFTNSKATKEEIIQAEADMDEVISELIPELKGIELDINSIMNIVEQLTDNIMPSDNKELKKKRSEL